MSRAAACLPVWAAIGLVLAACIVGKVAFGIPWNEMMGDPAAVTRRPFYLGFVSNVGALLWCATATVFLFAFGLGRGEPEPRRYLLCSGLFVALLGIDDFFLLHDEVFPNYLSVSQRVVVGIYAALALLFVARFSATLARTAYPIFVAAMALLAFSALFDQLQDRSSISFFGSGFVEDAAKLLGIGTWLSYAIHTSAHLVLSSVGAGATSPPSPAPARRGARVRADPAPRAARRRTPA
jgi:hypothetical protein